MVFLWRIENEEELDKEDREVYFISIQGET